MKLKHKAATLIAGLALAVLPTLQVAAKENYFYDFSKTLRPWISVADGSQHSLQLMAEDGVTDYGERNTFANLSTDDVSLDRANSGRDVPLPVGLWAMAKFPASGNQQIRVNWIARSTQNCVGCELRVYVGRTAPVRITQFASVNGKALTGYWQSFSYTTKVPQDTTPDEGKKLPLYIAIGLSSDDVAIGLDNIEVDIFPAP